jgi:hypothetical protein
MIYLNHIQKIICGGYVCRASIRAIVFYLFLVFIPVLLPCLYGIEVLGAPKCTVYFYNPESNVDNFALLKTKLDMYLKNLGPYQFQPFCDRNTFEAHARGKHDCILILSSWYYKELKDFFPMKPVLVGTVDGESVQKKILASKADIKNLSQLKNASIASAGSEEYTRKYLKLMMGENDARLVDTFRILSVPKDIDALISMGFGLVQAALTTEYSITKLSIINQGLYKKLTILVRNEKSLHPIVAIPAGHDAEALKLLEIIENMEKTTEGKSCMQLFGVEGWRILDKKDLELLGK